MPNLFSKLVDPWYPANAMGLERGIASVVHLEKNRGNTCSIRHAAIFALADSLIRPAFDARNIDSPSQLATILNELATGAGLLRQKRWSLSLPEASAKTLLLTIETQPQSSSELQEVLRWKMERGFGVPLEDVSFSREKLNTDPNGRERYLAIGIRKEVLAEYESVCEMLGWRAGLILPRHLGELQWLARNGSGGDALLLSGSGNGFTAVILRDRQPLIVRTVTGTVQEFEDEFYRFLLYYRDRHGGAGDTNPSLTRLLVVGDGLTRVRAVEIVNETTGIALKPLEAQDLGLLLPGRDLTFDAVAAPAGLATLAL